MPKRRDETRPPFDTIQELLRRDAEREDIPQEPKPKPEKVSYGVKAGRKGGKVTAKKLSAKKRKEIDTKAAKSRWPA